MATLYVVATPIGNLGDLSRRAEETLRSVSLVVCEDTRVTSPLLVRIGSKADLKASYKGREAERTADIIEKLNAGHDVALVSDAGTPLISDPGERLVMAAAEAGHRVVPVPGPSAPITLLSASGLPAERFTFIGFLPSHDRRRDETLGGYRLRPETLVFLESPRRLVDTLKACARIFGETRPAAVGRELTKLHEEVVRGTLKLVLDSFEQREDVPGEVTVAIAGHTGAEASIDIESLRGEIEAAIRDGEGTRRISDRISAVYGISRKTVYSYVLKLSAEISGKT